MKPRFIYCLTSDYFPITTQPRMKKFTFIFSFAILLSFISTKSFSQTAAFTFTLDPVTGCSPVNVTFQDQSTGATSWSWNLDNGSSAVTLQNPSVTYTTPGTYHVTLTINGGASTIEHDIVVYDVPTASFSISDTVVCAGVPVTFTSTSVAAGGGTLVQYRWGIDGSLDSTTGSVISHTFPSAGSYIITLVVKDSHGCYPSSAAIHTISVIASPIASFTMSPPAYCGSTPVLVSFTNTTSPTATTYQWDFGDPGSGAANTSSLQDASHTFNTQANYAVTLTATSGNCTTTSTQTFYWQNMNADFSVSTDTVCFYDAVQFHDLSSPPPSSLYWNFGDPGSSLNSDFVANPMHVFSAPGLYTVTLSATIGSCSNNKTMQIYVRPQPVINFTVNDSMFCAPSTAVFTPVSNPAVATAFFDFNFQFPNTDTSSLTPHSHLFPFGFFNVEMIVTDIYGCKDTILKNNYIQVIAPQASFSPFTPDSGCVPLTINFDGISSTSPADPIVSYHWNFGDGDSTTSGSSSTTHTYTQTGIWDVTLTITTASGCTATITRPKWERAGLTPTAAFIYTPAAICFGDTVQFHDSSTIALPEHITGWLWDFGDGGSSIIKDPKHKYDLDSGLYTVTLIVYDNGCPDTLVKDTIITVHPPKPDFQTQQNCTSPLVVNFSSTSHGADSLVWDWADGSAKDTANNVIVNHTFPGRGDYWVKITAWNYQYNCMYTDSHLVQIRVPLAVLSQNETIACYPATIQFIGVASLDAAGYTWDFGDPNSGAFNSSSLGTPNHAYYLPGSYLVTLLVTDIFGCTDTAQRFIRIQGPVPGFTVNNTTGCTPLAVQFSDTTHFNGSPVANYHWDFNYPTNTDFLDTTALSFTHVFNITNQYTIQLVVTDTNGCVDSVLVSNFISATFPDPQLNSLDTFLCPGSSNIFSITNYTSFVQTFPQYSVTWHFGDGTTDTTIQNNYQVSHTYTDTADHVYALTVSVTDSNNCTKTVTRNITVISPSANFDTLSTNILCGYSEVTLQGPIQDSIYLYNFTVYGPSPNIVYNKIDSTGHEIFVLPYPGHYYAILTVTNPGCSATDTLDPLVVVPGPSGSFTFTPDSGCSPLTVTFHLSPDNATSFNYDFGDGTPNFYSSDTVVTHTYYGNGHVHFHPNVSLGFSYGGSNCYVPALNLSDSLIYINNNLSVNITQDSVLLQEGHTDTITVATPYDPTLTYAWSILPNHDAPSVGTPPTTAYYTGVDGDTYVFLTVQDINGCQAYDSVRIYIKPCEKDIVIPNVFTPSGDNLNETYYIKDLCPIQDFRITIFNRWGNIVYESSDYAFHWDGVDSNGRDCSEGVYYYTLHAKRSDLHGYIHLIRGKQTN